MKSRTSIINCPDCNAPITLEINQLLQGSKFSCINCHASISLATDSKKVLENAVHSYQKAIL